MTYIWKYDRIYDTYYIGMLTFKFIRLPLVPLT